MFIRKIATHGDFECGAQHKQDIGNEYVAIVQLSRVGMFSALDLPKQANEPERLFIAFSANEVTPTVG